jgi:hypothetical protein
MGMTRSPLRLIPVAMSLLAVLVAAGCAGGPTGPSGPSPHDLAAQAVREMTSHKTVHVKGTFTGGRDLQVDLTMATAKDGDATMTGSLDGAPITLAVVDGKTFAQGAEMWPKVGADSEDARAFGAKWVLVHPDDLTTNGSTLTSIAPALRQLLSMRAKNGSSLAGPFSLGRTVNVDGKKAMELKAGGVTWDVTASTPHRILRVSAGDAKEAAGPLSDVRLDADHNATLQAAAPPQYLDIKDDSTWPARYDVDDDPDTGDDCNQFSCPMSVSATNEAGPPEGQSTVTITAKTPAGDPIASCSAPIPALAHGQSATVSCAITGDGWKSYVDNNAPEGGFAKFQASVSVSNPPYDG